ncbi:MAG: hypothetical protein IIZ75_05465 [Lachnospiraceae bacterium]|nr:hypothetical protein [Lachnospiraceae bacterium]
MDKKEILERLIEAYSGYYNIERLETPAPAGPDTSEKPSVVASDGIFSLFDATGYLANEAQQYFLVKAAKIADVNSYEHVYFKKCAKLDMDLLTELDRTAWEDGISKVRPYSGHKNTDIALIIIADEITDDAANTVSALKHSKNYKLGLYGFSNYRLVVIEARNGLILTNRRGKDLKDFVTHILINKVGKGE